MVDWESSRLWYIRAFRFNNILDAMPRNVPTLVLLPSFKK